MNSVWCNVSPHPTAYSRARDENLWTNVCGFLSLGPRFHPSPGRSPSARSPAWLGAAPATRGRVCARVQPSPSRTGIRERHSPPAAAAVYSHGRALLRVMSWRADHGKAVLCTTPDGAGRNREEERKRVHVSENVSPAHTAGGLRLRARAQTRTSGSRTRDGTQGWLSAPQRRLGPCFEEVLWPSRLLGKTWICP